MKQQKKRGFVYVATGEGYVREAMISAASLRVHHPEAIIDLITDSPTANAGSFSHVRRPEGSVERSPIDKLLAYEAPYDEVVFLDTDTYVAGNLQPVFDLLATHDLALLQDVNRGWNYELPGLPMAYSEFNTGVLAFRKSASVGKFFADWKANFRALQPALINQSQPPLSDQPSLRYTLFHAALRVAPLPSEFHFLADFPNATMWKVRLFHGRGDLPKLSAEVNADPGLRVYLPHGGCLGRFRGQGRFIRDAFRFGSKALQSLTRPFKDPASKCPSSWAHTHYGSPTSTETKL